jgi:hypothetical protein
MCILSTAGTVLGCVAARRKVERDVVRSMHVGMPCCMLGLVQGVHNGMQGSGIMGSCFNT